ATTANPWRCFVHLRAGSQACRGGNGQGATSSRSREEQASPRDACRQVGGRESARSQEARSAARSDGRKARGKGRCQGGASSIYWVRGPVAQLDRARVS